MIVMTPAFPAHAGARPEVAATFMRWLGEAAFPWWAERCLANANGAFAERLSPDGDADVQAKRRVRVQARQTYAFAVAAASGWADTRSLALRGGAHLLEACRNPSVPGRYHHAVAPDGRVTEARSDLYEQACVILALSALYALDGDTAWRDAAFEAVGYVRTELRHPAGGYMEGDPHRSPRRQNPHMHMLEAYLALLEITGDKAVRDGAAEMVALFENHFFDPARGVLLEDFNEDLSALPGGCVEPGHEMEWVCLLENWARLSGGPLHRAAPVLFAHARGSGVNPATSLLYDAIEADGAVRAATSRLWPQTERVKAEFVMARIGRGAFRDAAAALDGLRRAYFSGTDQGRWHDLVDAAGRPAAGPVPSSALYHLTSMALEIERYSRARAER